MSAVFGFYYNGKMKITFHQGVGHPKALGYDLFKTLYYSWPQEIMYMFRMLNVVHAADKPDEVQIERMKEKIGLGVQGGWKFNKPLKELTFQEILSEVQTDVFRYFTLIRHAGLMFMLDGFENVKTWGVAEWVYIYNLNKNRVEIWKNKEFQPTQQTLYTGDDMERLKENFDLIHTMIHDQTDLGRNQFDLSGMDYAYDLVMSNIAI